MAAPKAAGRSRDDAVSCVCAPANLPPLRSEWFSCDWPESPSVEAEHAGGDGRNSGAALGATMAAYHVFQGQERQTNSHDTMFHEQLGRIPLCYADTFRPLS